MGSFRKRLLLRHPKKPLFMRTLVTLALAGCLLSGTVSAQGLKVPAPSPMQTVDQAFALSNIKVEYSRPSAKGRTIFGDVVPFGKIWRTGANGSTKITFGEDVMIEGKSLAAGTYSIYTIPAVDRWEVMFNKDLTLGGDVANYKTDQEVLRVTVSPARLTDRVETFTINMADLTANSARVDLMWENTRASFAVKADIDSKIMTNITKTMAMDSRPYFQAAGYYYDNGKDLGQALNWVNKAVEQNPKAFYMYHLKAKIQLKQGDKAGAIATAQKSIELAREAQNADYVAMNEKLIAQAKAK